MEDDLSKFILEALKKPNALQRSGTVLNSNSIAKLIMTVIAKNPNDNTVKNIQTKLRKVINSNKTVSNLYSAIKNAAIPVNVAPKIKAVINKNEVPDNVALGVLALISGMIKPETSKKIIEETSNANFPKKAANIGNKIISIILSTMNYMPANRNESGAPIIPPGGKPGFVLTTRQGKFGWWRNTSLPPVGAPVGPMRLPFFGAPVKPPRNYTNMNIDSLLRAMRNTPENRNGILKEIKKKIDSMRRDLRYESGGKRARKWGEFLRRAPRNLPGRRNVTSNLINTIREVRNRRELENFTSNLGSVPNENIRRAIAEQRRRFARKMGYETENEYRRREGGVFRRPSGNANNIMRHRRSIEQVNRLPGGQGSNLSEIIRRRTALAQTQPRPPLPPPYMGNNELARRRAEISQPLPPPQQHAINNAGGVQRAMNTISQVPGGAPEVAKAAEALNEMGGNTAQAVNVKGASPAAVKAVQNLGGARNTVSVLEGLNTLSQTTATQKRKRRTRSKKVVRPRIAELNRVIEAVKKQKLISMVAHNITKTHNIHPNDEKLKKYYKKIIKANILRTPFAAIAKKAAKKI